tara:strand:+ start:1045 stop:3483 length:2439 start_codon:yes stop_codon:yes gene_type:complete
VAGPTEQQTVSEIVLPGESREVYGPSSLAWLVENLEVGPDGIATSIVGPSILRIGINAFASSSSTAFEDVDITDDVKRAIDGLLLAPQIPKVGYKTARPHSIFSARLLNGGASTLLYRFGSRLYRFNGGINNPDEILASGFSSPNNPDYPDQYVLINDKIVFTNGIDRAKIISYDGNVADLGFSRPASTPTVSSPSQPEYEAVSQYYPNSMGYSWQGSIGTPGDELTGREGSLLAGAWYYYTQYEDIYGNLSEFSLPSEPAVIRSNQAEPYRSFKEVDGSFVVKDGRYSAPDDDAASVILGRIEAPEGSEIDDLTRRFLVRGTGDAPEHTAAVRIYRTKDTQHSDPTPRYVARIPGSKQFVYDDNSSDTDLGLPWSEPTSVPVFRVACAHQGRLIIGNTPGDPGIVRRSAPGRPGTFAKSDFTFPDSGGAEITALASHNGMLIAFTATEAYAIGDDFKSPQPLLRGVGCIAPRSIAARIDGTLVWLSQDGFYGLDATGQAGRMSSGLDRVFRNDVSRTQLHLATSLIDHETGEYRCALAPAGQRDNLLMFCFDGKFWRRQTLGIHIADMCTSTEFTQYNLAIGSDEREADIPATSKSQQDKILSTVDLSRVFILNRQSTDYFGPPRRIRYRSAWLKASSHGLNPLNVRNLYVGLLDSWVGSATIRLYRNGSWDPVSEVNDLLLHGPDDGALIIEESAVSAVVGEAKVRDPRIFWRQIPVDIQNANSWAFELEIIGSPSPRPPRSGGPYEGRERAAWDRLLRDAVLGGEAYRLASSSTDSWELGRVRLAAFAFDVSFATKGSPNGRVPFRQDK